MTAIWGSRQKAKLALKRNLPTPKNDNNQVALSVVIQGDNDGPDTKRPAVSGGSLQPAYTKESISRLQYFQSNISAIHKSKKKKGLHGCGPWLFYCCSRIVFGKTW